MWESVAELNTGADVLLGMQYVSPLNAAFRAFHQNRLLVLSYHGVVPGEYARDPLRYPNIVTISEFSRQMERLIQVYHPIAASELGDWKAGRGRVTRNAALVTFDDGYRNNLIYAAPILERCAIPALITICARYIGSDHILWTDEIHWNVMHWPEKLIPMPLSEQQRVPNDFAKRLTLANRLRESCKRLPHEQIAEYLNKLRSHDIPRPNDEIHAFLSWDEVRALKRRGFEIGSHTVEHPILTQLPRERLVSEIRDSKRIIEEQIGGECAFFAYPNGGPSDISLEVVQEVRRAGYRFAFTVMGRLSAREEDPLLLDRVYIPAGISAGGFERRTSGLHNALKQLLRN
jgi:peptidoglycan/xylan/chitin deacetylase (PgdA/CDA1 family)